MQLILGTVYGYSIFWEPLESEIFPTVITQAQHDAKVAGGEDVTGAVVVADEQKAVEARTQQQGYLKYALGKATFLSAPGKKSTGMQMRPYRQSGSLPSR